MSTGPEWDPELSTKRIPALTVPGLYQFYATGPNGLTQAESEERLHRFGPNVIREVKGKSLVWKFFANFTHLMAIMLWIGGAVGFIAQMPQLGIAIWMVNIINGLFSFWQEYRAEKATEALKKLLPSYVRVLRDGEERRILSEDLVPGDLMLLSEGDRISADGRLVEVSELRIDQSTLTGESRPVRKTSEPVLQPDLTFAELPNMVYAGTNVATGTGRATVTATAMATEFGKIAYLTQTVRDELSPLQREMAVVTKIVTVIACSVGAIFFLFSAVLVGVNLAESFIFAMGTQRMAGRNALIKQLSAVETLGCTTVICTDKTGTLTQNEMTVRDLWLSYRSLTVTGAGYTPVGQILEREQPVAPDTDLRQLLIAASLCNNARVIPPNPRSAHWTILGDPTEAAMKVVALKGGLDLEEEARSLPRLREIPFDSTRKRMSTIHQASSSRVVFVKGAPKEILGLCSHIRINQEYHPMDGQVQARIMAANDEYARNGLRVLAVALRDLPDAVSDYRPEFIETDLSFLGLVAMMDPPREEVTLAVEKCHRAGIRIVMITGDYGLTAESIARRIGIIRQQRPRIISGNDLDALDDHALEAVFRDEVIFARVSPEHKLRVVTALQEQGHIVAVTGDGVNDAPALKKADIGVAMGIAGTDVAKEAAVMILTDDNFASIVNAIEEGRGVYANIKKFISYIFTSNTPEAVPFILWALSRGRIPLALNVMQILSVDLGTDMVPALALGNEPPEKGVMDAPPRNMKEHVITRSLIIRAYLFLGLIQSFAAMAAFYFMYWVNGYWGQWLDLPSTGILYQAATAMTLGAVVTTQIGNLFAQRTERISAFRLRWFDNRMLWVGIVSELLIVSLIIYVPFFQKVIGTASFPLVNWVFLFAWTPSLLLADELRKALLRRRDREKNVLSEGGSVV
jgi:magnesium-transporting ATPase (P-type)